MKNILQRPTFWFFLFAFLFLFTQDYLFPERPTRPVGLGLPNWLYWFMAIHALFMVTFYFFTKNYWK